MKRQTILSALIACFAVAACVVVPPVGNETRPMTAVDTSWQVGKGFDLDEAKTLIELCTSLDYSVGSPSYDTPGVAQPQNVVGWEEIFPTPESILPSNGPPTPIGFYKNSWRLYRNKALDKNNPPIYIIGIRGTIDDDRSVLQNALASTTSAQVRIQARPDRVLSFKLAETPRAEVHLGWTYGMAELMFDPQLGILKALHDRVPPGSRILITGHSQGAAIATLVHAFLHYAITADPSNKFGLRDSRYTLKSYVFAQPKPGNWQFAMDFARIAASRGTAFVINNDRDWVPQVPLSIQSFDEPGTDLAAVLNAQPSLRGTINSILASGAIGFAQGERTLVALQIQDETIRSIERGNRFEDRYLESGAAADGATPAYSIDYTVVGTQVPIFGSASPNIPIDHSGMAQHHGPTYRMLLESPEALGGPPRNIEPAVSYNGM